MATDLTDLTAPTDPAPPVAGSGVRVLIVTAGGPGDVMPFTGLGVGLRAAGHDVAVATHDTFEGLVTRAGLGFRPLPENPMRLGVQEDAATAPTATGLADVVDRITETGRAILRAAEDADVLLLHHTVTPLGWHVAEALRRPSLGVYLTPHGPTSGLPPHFFGRSLGRAGNLAAWEAIDVVGNATLVGKVARRLRQEMGLSRCSPRQMRARRDREGWPVCCGYSPALVPRPADWRPGVEAVGYWWPHVPEAWEPPALLVDFLAAGPPPVYVGFGTLERETERLAAVVPEALRRAGVRAVVQGGDWAAEAAGEDLLVVGDVPHGWLFPRMAAVVHAAGAGVSGAGLRAGVPAVPVPMGLDQPFWASQLVRRGVAPASLPAKALTVDALVPAIEAAAGDSRLRARGAELAAVVGAEDGTARVVDTVRRVVGATATA